MQSLEAPVRRTGCVGWPAVGKSSAERKQVQRYQQDLASARAAHPHSATARTPLAKPGPAKHPAAAAPHSHSPRLARLLGKPGIPSKSVECQGKRCRLAGSCSWRLQQRPTAALPGDHRPTARLTCKETASMAFIQRHCSQQSVARLPRTPPSATAAAVNQRAAPGGTALTRCLLERTHEYMQEGHRAPLSQQRQGSGHWGANRHGGCNRAPHRSWHGVSIVFGSRMDTRQERT